MNQSVFGLEFILLRFFCSTNPKTPSPTPPCVCLPSRYCFLSWLTVFIILIIKSCFIVQQMRRGKKTKKTRLQSAGWCTSLSKQERAGLYGGMWEPGPAAEESRPGTSAASPGGITAALRWIHSAGSCCWGWAVRAVSAPNCWSCEPVCVCAHHWKIRK